MTGLFVFVIRLNCVLETSSTKRCITKRIGPDLCTEKMHSVIFSSAVTFRANRIHVTEEDPIEDGIKKETTFRVFARSDELFNWLVGELKQIFTRMCRSGCASHSRSVAGIRNRFSVREKNADFRFVRIIFRQKNRCKENRVMFPALDCIVIFYFDIAKYP